MSPRELLEAKFDELEQELEFKQGRIVALDKQISDLETESKTLTDSLAEYALVLSKMDEENVIGTGT